MSGKYPHIQLMQYHVLYCMCGLIDLRISQNVTTSPHKESLEARTYKA